MGCGNPIKKVKKEFDRFLDRRVGIDDPGIRAGVNVWLMSNWFGGVVGAVGAASLQHDQDSQPLDPLKPFSLPTNFELTSARSELQSVLRKKRARSRTDFTGGSLPSAQVTAPRLKTV